MLVQQVRDLTSSAEFEHHNTSLRLPLGLEAPVITPNCGAVLFSLTTVPSLSNSCKLYMSLTKAATIWIICGNSCYH